jgi:hypothetical protein
VHRFASLTWPSTTHGLVHECPGQFPGARAARAGPCPRVLMSCYLASQRYVSGSRNRKRGFPLRGCRMAASVCAHGWSRWRYSRYASVLLYGSAVLAVPVAISTTVPFVVPAVWVFLDMMRVVVVSLSFSPYTCPCPYPYPHDLFILSRDSFGGRSVTSRVITMVVIIVRKGERREEVDARMNSHLLAEGAPCRWQ